MTLLEAAKEALAAFDRANVYCTEITNLQAAVDAVESQEPVTWVVAYDDPKEGRCYSKTSMDISEAMRLISIANTKMDLVPLFTRENL